MTRPLVTRLLPGCVAALLLASCSTAGGSPSAAPSPSPADPFTAIAPPNVRAVGSYPEIVVNRALQKAQGLLAHQLFEGSSLTGTDKAGLVAALTGTAEDLNIAKDLGATPTARGLTYRPLFAPGVAVTASAATVERSTWTADAVQGRGGEQGLRVTWAGSVRYAATVGGKAHDVAYALTVGYIFAALPTEPNGISFVAVVRGTSHAAPVLASCLEKGLLLPVAGTPTAADFGAGPWSTPSGSSAACPV